MGNIRTIQGITISQEQVYYMKAIIVIIIKLIAQFKKKTIFTYLLKLGLFVFNYCL